MSDDGQKKSKEQIERDKRKQKELEKEEDKEELLVEAG
jgi:hypothetical protein